MNNQSNSTSLSLFGVRLDINYHEPSCCSGHIIAPITCGLPYNEEADTTPSVHFYARSQRLIWNII